MLLTEEYLIKNVFFFIQSMVSKVKFFFSDFDGTNMENNHIKELQCSILLRRVRAMQMEQHFDMEQLNFVHQNVIMELKTEKNQNITFNEIEIIIW